MFLKFNVLFFFLNSSGGDIPEIDDMSIFDKENDFPEDDRFLLGYGESRVVLLKCLRCNSIYFDININTLKLIK
jgi:hypothetical protein